MSNLLPARTMLFHRLTECVLDKRGRLRIKRLKYSGIYAITSPSGNQYIGSAKNIWARWKQHLKGLRLGQHHSRILQGAWKKYGEENFTFSVLLICCKEDLVFYEARAFLAFKPKYNIMQVAANTLGFKHSEESLKLIGAESSKRRHKKKSKLQASASIRATMALPEVKAVMFAAAKRRAADPVICAKISAKLTGFKRPPRTAAHRKKLGKARLGSTHSLETRLQMSESHQRRFALLRAAKQSNVD